MTHEEFIQRFSYDPEKDKIGAGGFGDVFKAYDNLRKRYVAIKEAKVSDHKFTLLREVQLSNEIEPHGNIARYENCYRFSVMRLTMDYAVMKYYEYGNLNTVLKNQTLTLAAKREIIEGILQGVKHLHNEQIIHRDLKPHNILMDYNSGNWIPKIADLGLSRFAGQDGSVSNSAIGISYAYAAPEQLENRKIRPNVDLWAAGVIIYQVMTGTPPFRVENRGGDSDERSTQIELSKKIINVELPTELANVPPPFQEMIRRSLVYNTIPQAGTSVRVQSAIDLLDVLHGKGVEQDWEAMTVIDSVQQTPPPKPPKREPVEVPKEAIPKPKAKPKVQSEQKKGFRYWLFIPSLLLAAAALYFSYNSDLFFKKDLPVNIVQFTASDSLVIMGEFPGTMGGIPGFGKDPFQLPLHDGDKMIIERVKNGKIENKAFEYIYDVDEGNKIHLEVRNIALYANDKLHCLDFRDSIPISNMEKTTFLREKEQIRSIFFSKKTPISELNFVEKIMNNNGGNILLNTDESYSERRTLKNLLKGSKSKNLRIPGNNEFFRDVDFKSVEFLTLTKDKTHKILNSTLRAPKLKHLRLEGKFLASEIRILLSRLKPRALTISENDTLNSIYFLEACPQLTSLFLTGTSKIENYQPIQKLDRLNYLYASSASKNEVFGNLVKNISYLSVPLEQNELMAIVNNNPDIKLIDFYNSTTIKDISPLTRLSKLESIYFKETPDNLSPLGQIPNLKHVGIYLGNQEGDKEKGDKIVAQIRNLCPQCIVSRIGFCLGSGWLLLLPIGLLFCCIGVNVYKKRKIAA